MTYRKVTFINPEENISKKGYFHLLKKGISLDGSEVVYPLLRILKQVS